MSMAEPVEMFFQQTAEAFRFFEQQYGYRRQEGFVESSEDYRDTIARIRYVGSRVGMEIWWYFAGASIGVAFIELLQPGVFPEGWALFENSHHAAKAKAV